ncbi:MAG: hypothetical protein IANPNBLG_04144 [Bryobacteraceae bacterium]|nr:hypothetical protein [Bryobacteraceae bacterium]
MMNTRNSRQAQCLGLKAGEWVEVRGKEEILATLDQNGRLENLPFMPEMFQYCGQRLRVSKRADKTCDPAHTPWSIRRMTNSVHLENVRCDGAAHDGCQAGCLIFWKEAWLKRADARLISPAPVRSLNPPSLNGNLCTVESILAATRTENAQGETVYSCQAMELRNYTSFMKWWDPRQYIRDFRSGNLGNGYTSNASRSHKVFNLVLGILQIVQAVVIYIAWSRRGVLYPHIAGKLDKTPLETLDLQPGELVRVRGKEDIEATLDRNNRNRGLLFDTEMVPYCGGIYRVLRRVTHIIDEKTGKMMNMKYPCIILEGVYCKSDYHRLCPRAIYSYWRENWLERVDTHAIPPAGQEESGRNACHLACK